MKSPDHRRSRHFNIMLTILAVAGLVATLFAIEPLAMGSQASYQDSTGRHRHQDAGAAICDGDHDVWLDGANDRLSGWLNLDAAQQESWARVERELGQAVALLCDVCGDVRASGPPADIPDRLEAMESILTAGAEAVRAVRPVFAEFYGTLNDRQRRKIDEIGYRYRFDAP